MGMSFWTKFVIRGMRVGMSLFKISGGMGMKSGYLSKE